MPSILVVDDIEGVHEMLDILFEDTEFELIHAMSAAQGVQTFRDQSIDLILSDIQMPGGDGLRMLAELKQLDPDVVTVITTASESREFVVQALRLGAFDFVQKPYDEEVLLNSVRRAFAEVQRRRQFRQSNTAQLQQELQRLKLELQQHEEALLAASQKDEEINELRQQLQMRQERDLELRKRQMELDAREGAMKTMESVIQERLAQMAEQGASSDSGLSLEEMQKLEELKQQLEERESQIQTMEASLMEREASLMENEESLMEKGQRLIELETELEQIREDLESSGGGGAGGDEGLSPEQIAEIESMQEQIRQKEAALLEMEEKVAERERALKKSEMLMRAREQFLSQSESILFGEEKSGTSG